MGGPGQIDFFSLHPDELIASIGGTGRAKQAWELVRAGKELRTSDAISARLRETLADHFQLFPGVVDTRRIAADGTQKLRIALVDECRVETVIIPSQNRTTVCVSTQVGCARGCGFCASGQAGFTRQMSVGEIVFQVALAQKELKAASLAPVTNVVYMGMGEPLDNFEAVHKSIAILTHPHGFRLPQKRITLSTIGPSPDAIRGLKSLTCNLAWSMHAAEDGLRRQLIPRARHGNAVLRDAFLEVIQDRRAVLLIEMIMIAGINDRKADIDQLMDFWSQHKAQLRFNIIPLNPGSQPSRPEWAPSPPQRVASIRKSLQDAGFFCETRRPRGLEIDAACGQLAGGP